MKDSNSHIDYPIIPRTHSALYLMHKFWARKPANIVKNYILRYTNPGDIVLDPFMGSGVSVIESIYNNRKAVGIDINPISKFICENSGRLTNLSLLDKAYNYLLRTMEKEDSLYQKLSTINCPLCGKNATITHIIWIPRKNPKNETKNDLLKEDHLSYTVLTHKIDEIRLECPKCQKLYFSWSEISKKFDDFCNHILMQEKTALDHMKKLDLSPPSFKFQYPTKVPFLQLRHNLRENARLDTLFTNRNLAILTFIFHAIDNLPEKYSLVQNDLKFAFTAAIGQASKMVWIINKRRGKELSHRQVGSWTHHFFWDPSSFFEVNAWSCFSNRVQKLKRGKDYLRKRSKEATYKFTAAKDFNSLSIESAFVLYTRSSTQLPIPDHSIDFIFTDPPYGDSIQYGELASIWAAWLKMDMEEYISKIHTSEIVINSHQKKDLNFYASTLLQVFQELFRVLKPEKFIVLTFHNTSLQVRNSLITQAFKAGFALKQILFQLPPRVSIKSMLHHKGSPIGDYYIRFQKEKELSLKETPYFKTRINDSSSKKEIYNEIKSIVVEILKARGEPTLSIWIQNLLDEELFKANLLPLPKTQKYLKRLENDSFFTIDANDYWWFSDISSINGISDPLTERIKIYLTLNLPKLDFTEYSGSKKQILFNFVYRKFRGKLTPDKFKINQIIQTLLKK